jgi:hypothetical protein
VVLVKVRDFGKIGDIFSGVVNNGANSVSNLNFTIDDPTAVQNEARTEAIKRAREKAASIARAGSFRIGRLLGIDEGFSGPMPFYANKSFDFNEIRAGAAPAIEPGSEEVKVTVTLRYEIE